MFGCFRCKHLLFAPPVAERTTRRVPRRWQGMIRPLRGRGSPVQGKPDFAEGERLRGCRLPLSRLRNCAARPSFRGSESDEESPSFTQPSADGAGSFDFADFVCSAQDDGNGALPRDCADGQCPSLQLASRAQPLRRFAPPPSSEGGPPRETRRSFHDQTSAIIAISAASPRRGPVLITRV